MFVAGCSTDGGSPAPTPELSNAERLWLDVLPMFENACSSCHTTTNGAPDFLAGDDAWEIRDNLLASGIVDPSKPTSSRILTKGIHSGPALTSTQNQLILDWLEAELQH